MQHNLKRLSPERRELVHFCIKVLLAWAWLRDHTPHVSAGIGVVMLIPAIWLGTVLEWGMLFGIFSFLHMYVDKMSRRRAHWIGSDKTRPR